ncbi:hypothetical protein [Shewanella surugensis]|uniref:Uncharacterized protein n=1 Tax=Shewanella surugensis TaxID=212020 RepID=A0ABT0LFC9_9GAMM|nr:hypothetical protein [Shewanella surugensis]MCL1126409.1 hypothetical protein [Shewanella surugensis]
MQINVKAALLLFVVFLISGCSKITYEEHCAPKLTYRFPDSALFAVMDIEREALAHKIQSLGLASRVSFEIEPYDDFPEAARQQFSMIKVMSNSVQLLGPVIRYQAPFLRIGDSHDLWFYADIGGHLTWLTESQLSSFTAQYPTKNHTQNELKLIGVNLNRFDLEALPECMKK